MTQQMTLNFQPGLTAQYRSLREVSAAAVYGSRKGVAGVAADLDLSPTDLTKRLNLDSAEPRPLRAEDVEGIVSSTGDLRPIYWMVEKFCRDADAQQRQAVAQIAALLPALEELVRQAKPRG
jgi:hypothetical protein